MTENCITPRGKEERGSCHRCTANLGTRGAGLKKKYKHDCVDKKEDDKMRSWMEGRGGEEGKTGMERMI